MSKRLAILAVALVVLLVVFISLNADAIRTWRYAQMTTGDLLSAAQREPEKLSLVNVAGTRLLQDGRYEEARSLLVPIATRHPEDDALNVLAGRAEWNGGNPQQATRLFLAALESNPANVDAAYWSALVVANRGSKTKAEALLMQVIQLDPKHGDAWSALGEIAYKARDLPKALERYNHAEQLTPTEHVALLRARVLKDMGRYDEAEAAAREAVARGSSPQAYALLGEIVQLSPTPARLREAQGYLHEALRNDPDNAGILNLLGINYRRLGEHRQAVKALRRMLRSQPAMPEGYMLLHQSYRTLGKTKLADKSLRIYRQLEPLQAKVTAAENRATVERGAVSAKLRHARALLELGRYDLARNVIGEAMVKAADDPEVLTLARLAQGPPHNRIPPLPPDPEGDTPLAP